MKLSNCDKCGSNAYMAMSIHNYCARCEVCDNHGEWKATEVEAARNWNMRNEETEGRVIAEEGADNGK